MARPPARRLTREETSELSRVTQLRHPQILAVARGADDVVILLPDRMVIRRPRGWEMVAWQDIQRGGFSDAGELSWELTDGTKRTATIDDVAIVPRAFQELIRSSIIVSRRMELTGGLGSVMISGRRSPTGDGAVSWQTEALGRCNLSDSAVQSQVLELVARMRAEFE